MSGPPYPHPNPVPGSNAIGQFQIGVSPIGTIPAFDVWKTVISQYANSPILTALITCLNAALDQTQNMDSFYDTIWNVLTAVGYGLDVWGRIVGVSRIVQLPSTGTYLGFQEAGSWVGFGQGSFYSGGAGGTSTSLSDSAYRLLVLGKTAANIWNGSIPQLNQILLSLFPGLGNCWVADGGNLTLTYTFAFTLTQTQFAIVNSGVLPRPSGVSYRIVQSLAP
ncbi:MAG: DUF2612 domain-containing protein [Gemmataceae bacterium]